MVQRSPIRRGLPRLAAAVGEWNAYCAPTMEAPEDDAELLDELADVAPPQALAALLPDVTTRCCAKRAASSARDPASGQRADGLSGATGQPVGRRCCRAAVSVGTLILRGRAHLLRLDAERAGGVDESLARAHEWPDR